MNSKTTQQKKTDEAFKLCLSCGHFEGIESEKVYCVVCGMRLLEQCPECHLPIFYPTAKFCPACGREYVAGMSGKGR